MIVFAPKVPAIVGFVEHFFSCEECRRNFLERNRHIASKINTNRGKDVILWLWKEHNYVSARINRERSSSGKNVRQTFPGRELCASCYKSRGSNGLTNSLENKQDPEWDEDVVVRFLVATYCFDDTVLHCDTMTAPNYSDSVITVAFMLFFMGFVVLRYTGKRLNKKMH